MAQRARFGSARSPTSATVQQVQERMPSFRKLDAPVMTSISVHSRDSIAESWPGTHPRLYRGEPLVVAMRVHDASAKFTLQRSIAIDVVEGTDAPAAWQRSHARLWAARRSSR